MSYCPVCQGSHSGTACTLRCITCSCALESYFYQRGKGPFCWRCAEDHGDLSRSAKVFERSLSCHQMPCIQGEVTHWEHLVLRHILHQSYIDHPDYLARQKVSPFFQGGSVWSPVDGTQWVLIEFWCGDTQAIDEFIAYVNKRLDDSTRSEQESKLLAELLQFEDG